MSAQRRERCADPRAELRSRFPAAHRYLGTYETALRAREQSKAADGTVLESPFNDDDWYRFGRNQNLDKQDAAKLIVAQTVPEMRVCADMDGAFSLNNVRVNGILSAPGGDLAYLMGALNGALADFVFRRIGKPKQGGWFEANKQFIAPLPIPDASPDDRAEVARRARDLQDRWTSRRDLDRAAQIVWAPWPARGMTPAGCGLTACRPTPTWSNRPRAP